MKKKKRNFIIKICSLLLLGIISITLLGSWTYDPQTDTITSDNLYDYDKVISTLGGTITINENNISLTNNNGNGDFYLNEQLQANTTYTISYSNITNILNIRLFDTIGGNVLEFLDVSTIITFTPQANCFLRIWIDYNLTFTGSIMLNYGSNALPYEPYGQTYVNQQRLDTLELEYDDLAEQYSNLYDEKEQIQNDYNSLQQDYDTLVAEYDSLQADYNTLNTAYDLLEINYNRAIDDLDQLRDEYADLQQQLADLNAELNLLRPYIFNSSDIVVKIGNATQTGDNFTASSVVSNVSSYFDNYGSFDLDSLYSNYSGFGSTYNAICFEVPNYNLMMYNVSFSFTGYPDMLFRLNYQDSVGNNLVVARDFTESYTDLYGFSIVSGLRNSSMWDSSQPIEYCTYSKIVFVGLNTGALNVKNLNFSSSSGYSEGFNQGYNSIKNTTDTIITRLNNQIDSLNSTIDNLHNQITDLQNQLNNSVGWRPLFFAMADTPLKVVSNVLGFELFGLNLFQAFIGIITALAIIWLIRKIWK